LTETRTKETKPPTRTTKGLKRETASTRVGAKSKKASISKGRLIGLKGRRSEAGRFSREFSGGGTASGKGGIEEGNRRDHGEWSKKSWKEKEPRQAWAR